jgi:hypothetical protein
MSWWGAILAMDLMCWGEVLSTEHQRYLELRIDAHPGNRPYNPRICACPNCQDDSWCIVAHGSYFPGCSLHLPAV